MNAEDLLQRWDSLKNARGQFDTHWQELAERMLPKRADFTSTSPTGSKRTSEILDSTPLQARRQLVAAVHSMLLPPNAQWFDLNAMDADIAEDDEVGQWLDDVESRMWQAIYDPMARFREATGETIEDLVTFGTGVMFIGSNVDRLQFRCYHLRDCWISENAGGLVDTLYLRRNMTARQAAELYGPDSSEAIRDALKANKPEKQCEYLSIVTPRKDRDPGRVDNKSMPFAHYMVEPKEQRIVEESGFWDFPYAVPRWETAAEEVYGRSPAMLALPDVKTLNEQRWTTLQAGHLAVDPPWAYPGETAVNEDSFFPGGFLPYDLSKLQGNNGRNAIFPLISGQGVPLGLEMENQTREMVWNAFFRDVLRLPMPEDFKGRSATEVLIRREEFARIIGPVFSRQEHELPAVVVNRVFGIMSRANAFPPPPDILDGRAIDFEFKSAVQQAQKRIEAAATAATFEQAALLISVKPQVLDNIDEDAVFRDMMVGNGAPHDHLRGKDVVAQIRQQAAQAAQAQEAAAMVAGAAESMGKAAPMVKAMQGPA